jgi:hypothetical protein
VTASTRRSGRRISHVAPREGGRRTKLRRDHADLGGACRICYLATTIAPAAAAIGRLTAHFSAVAATFCGGDTEMGHAVATTARRSTTECCTIE